MFVVDIPRNTIQKKRYLGNKLMIMSITPKQESDWMLGNSLFISRNEEPEVNITRPISCKKNRLFCLYLFIKRELKNVLMMVDSPQASLKVIVYFKC